MVVEPIPAHSHNDYYRDRPLLEALEAGCISVEVDVFERDGRLLVGHDPAELVGDRTLEAMYLEPLAGLVREHGWLLPERRPLILMVDFKTPDQPTYAALCRRLEPYRFMLHRVEQGRRVAGAVRVVVSGHRPTQAIVGNPDRLADLDGRPGEQHGGSADSVPVQSASWRSFFSLTSYLAMTPVELAKLRALVDEGHSRGQLVRFWAMPDNEAGWQLALESGIDLINTDKPGEVALFYRRWQQQHRQQKQNPGRMPPGVR